LVDITGTVGIMADTTDMGTVDMGTATTVITIE
jgi:hypothetical protein